MPPYSGRFELFARLSSGSGGGEALRQVAPREIYLDLVADAYEEHFEPLELEELAEFYRKPLGKKLALVRNRIWKHVAKAGARFLDTNEDFQDRFNEEYRKIGIR